MMLGAGIRVFVRGGELTVGVLNAVPAMSRGVPLHPDDPEDPYVFRIRIDSLDVTARVVFRPDESGGATSMHTDLGLMSFRRRT